MYSKEEVCCFKRLKEAVIDMDETEASKLAQEMVREGYDLEEGVREGLIQAMDEVSRLYDEEEYFIPDLLSCADAMYCALEVLTPHLKGRQMKKEGIVVIGSVLGDTHDIGKNIVALFLESAGFEVINLGRDVSPDCFIEEAVAHHADIIILSTLMTTTMPVMKDVICLLEERGIRKNFIVMVGGRPLSIQFARNIGADGYSADAKGAVKMAKKFMSQKKQCMAGQ